MTELLKLFLSTFSVTYFIIFKLSERLAVGQTKFKQRAYVYLGPIHQVFLILSDSWLPRILKLKALIKPK